MQPRGTTWPASVQLDVPRDLTGTGEYVRLLAEVRPSACWAGAHRAVSKPSHWELAPSAAGLFVHRIKIRQHYETPAALVATVRRLWAPDFDAMASPINAVCEDYCTLEDDFDAPLFDRRIFVNPAYDTEGLQHTMSAHKIAAHIPAADARCNPRRSRRHSLALSQMPRLWARARAPALHRGVHT
jgi:hypothetical protein